MRGVNDRAQLAFAERIAATRRAQALLEAGTWIADPARIDLRGTLACGRDVRIDVGCVFEGDVKLADDVEIGAVLRAARRDDRRRHVDPAVFASRGRDDRRHCRIGPYSRLRPGAALADEVHVGNFVEIKASTLGTARRRIISRTSATRPSARNVNYGAGSITANYDGANKHRTIIGDDVHIGSNCVLVAPITIGAAPRSAAAARSCADAPARAHAGARQQISVAGWQRPAKKPREGEHEIRHVRHRRRSFARVTSSRS